MGAALMAAEAGAPSALNALVPVSPVQFAVVVRKKRLYPWQARIMADVAAGRPTAAVTPNEAGKTSIIIATLALWCLHEFPGATVVLTSATYRAVRTQIFAALEQERPKLTHWQWKDTEIEDGNGGRILGFATDSGAKFEGFHAGPGRPLLIILDEAKSIADEIFEAADRCNATMLLYISSAGGNFGRFHDALRSARFAKHEIGIADCPHITPERIEAMREQYGEDSDIYRSMIEGKFAKGNEAGKVVAFADYERCLANPPQWSEGVKQVFCDFADSGDLCIVAKRDGNRLAIHDQWKPDGNKAGVAERFERNLRALYEQGYALMGDEDGTGHGYITTLNLRGLPIRGVRNNAPATDAHYFNLNAQQWWTFAKQAGQCRWILPHDETLKRQLCTREQNFVLVDGKKRFGREDGKLQLQPKRRSGMASPNHADAIIGAAYDYPLVESRSYLNGARDGAGVLPSRYQEMQDREGAEEMAGMTAGDY